jgi:hypothetical protein
MTLPARVRNEGIRRRVEVPFSAHAPKCSRWHGPTRFRIRQTSRSRGGPTDKRANGQTRYVSANEAEPPAEILYDLDEALTLLGALEDARDALVDSGHLAVVVSIEDEIRALSRKLGFDDPAGGTDGR